MHGAVHETAANLLGHTKSKGSRHAFRFFDEEKSQKKQCVTLFRVIGPVPTQTPESETRGKLGLEDVRPLGADGSVGYECRARRFDDVRRDGWGRPVVHRRALYGAWNALANLADLTGKVSVSARAEGALDKAKLEKGVLEPLRELKLIDE